MKYLGIKPNRINRRKEKKKKPTMFRSEFVMPRPTVERWPGCFPSTTACTPVRDRVVPLCHGTASGAAWRKGWVNLSTAARTEPTRCFCGDGKVTTRTDPALIAAHTMARFSPRVEIIITSRGCAQSNANGCSPTKRSRPVDRKTHGEEQQKEKMIWSHRVGGNGGIAKKGGAGREDRREGGKEKHR